MVPAIFAGKALNVSGDEALSDAHETEIATTLMSVFGCRITHNEARLSIAHDARDLDSGLVYVSKPKSSVQIPRDSIDSVSQTLPNEYF